VGTILGVALFGSWRWLVGLSAAVVVKPAGAESLGLIGLVGPVKPVGIVALIGIAAFTPFTLRLLASDDTGGKGLWGLGGYSD
jgi:hypothetical protein